MTTKEFISILEHFVPFDDDDEQSNDKYFYDLTDDLVIDRDSCTIVEPVLKLLEKYPTADFGTPGPLVHILEKLTGSYEEKLLESIKRKPTPLTTWMLNRLINGSEDNLTRLTLMKRLEEIVSNPKADEITKQEAIDFLKFQQGK